MLQVIYISTAATGMSESVVADILRVSRMNNAAADVTGLLLYDGYRFLQALEGPSAEVNAIYARVKIDPRHRALVMLHSRDIAERAFGSWAMAAQRVAVAQGATLPDLVDSLTAHVADCTTKALFRSFSRVRAAA